MRDPFDLKKWSRLWYRLDRDKQPVSVSLGEWVEWIAESSTERTIGDSWIGHIRVVTLFIGFAAYVSLEPEDDRPLLFETMIFGDEGLKDQSFRYRTHEDAEKGHKRAINLVYAIQTLSRGS